MTRVIFFILLMLVPGVAGAQSVDKAYQREFSYLQAQKGTLQKRIAGLKRQSDSESAASQRELGALQDRLVALQLEADTLQEQLAEIDRAAVRSTEHNDGLVAVFEQAKGSLERYGVEVVVPEKTPTPAALQGVFASAMQVLDDGGKVRKHPGSFFLQGGERVEGEITEVGRIAAYGVSPNAAGPLAPAGEGRLKLWSAGDAATARAFAAGGSPKDNVGIFLFESVDKAVEEKAEKTALGTIEAGGLVAWVIVALGLVALLLTAARGLLLMLSASPQRDIDEACHLVSQGRFDRARAVLAGSRGATAKVLAHAAAALGKPENVVEDLIAEAMVMQERVIHRFGTAIMVVAAVSPLLGLLGTVTGMIATFDVITEFGTGDPKMLSGGISEALITTQLGLMVAIPALLVGNLLNARAASLLEDLEHAALRLINATRKEPGDGDDRVEPKVAPSEPRLAMMSGTVLESA